MRRSNWIKNHMNEERTMKNGEKAKIVGGKYDNLTIEFEDGTIKTGVAYHNFECGGVRKVSWIDEHMGEESTMKNGDKAKIIGGASNGITIEYEDGTVKTGVDYRSFKKGSVQKVSWIDRHMNEEIVMKNGEKAKIISGKHDNLTIEFEDGTIKTGVRYTHFRERSTRKVSWIDEHRGKEAVMTNGEKAKIIGGKHDNLTIEFEDGTVKTGVYYKSFIHGNVQKLSWLDKHRGEEHVYPNGEKAKIIDGCNKNVTIEFEDGTIRKNITYDQFKNHNIGKVSWADTYIGKAVTLKTGDKGVVTGRTRNGVEVQLENGTVATVRYGQYKYVEKASCNWLEKYEGKAYILQNGEKATILGIDDKGVIVRLDDGSIRTGVTDRQLEELESINTKWISKHINEEHVMHTGKEAKIIGKDTKGVIVQFSDGTVRCGVPYIAFKKGHLGRISWISRHLSERVVLGSGIAARIIGGESRNKINVEFEDGAIRNGVSYTGFASGNLSHPTLDIRGGQVHKGSRFGSFNVYKMAFKNETTYYTCECTKCRYNGILSPTEMIQHQCLV